MAAQMEHPPAQEQAHQPGVESAMFPAPQFMPKYPGSGKLAGKVAIISGGDSGIGRAVAVLFAREGARVAIIYLEEDNDAEETAELVEDEGSEAILLRGDIGDKVFCEEAITETLARFGRIDIVVNNAAEQHVQDDPTAISEEQLERTFRTNVFGYFYLTQAALPHLDAGSTIINTTSVTAYRGSPQLIDYAATRGAVVAFTRSLAEALTKREIRVNAVAPGPIWTPLIPSSFDAEKVEEHGTKAPLGRVGQPNEVAPCHLFLACEESSYMSGQVLHPNGGEVING
jgi:NAD(P)-dependent dehydrogenase (short-subunit alcohol dehydrogenase family)